MAVRKKESKENYVSEVKKIFFHPTEFFNSLKDENEKDYRTPLMFYFYISIAAIVISLIASIITEIISPQGISITTFILSLLSGIIFQLLMALVVPFIAAGIIHLGVLMFGGKQGFYNTFKPATYSEVITRVYGILMIIISLIFTIMLVSSGTHFPTLSEKPTTEEVNTYMGAALSNPLIVANLILSGIIMLISVIHSFIATVIGVAKFQKLKKGKACWAVAIIPLIIMLLLFLMMGLVWVALKNLPAAA